MQKKIPGSADMQKVYTLFMHERCNIMNNYQ